MRADVTRVVYKIHRLAGLIVSVNLIVFCVTGLLLLFHEEIDDALGAAPPSAAVDTRPALPASALIAAAQQQRPGERPLIFAPLEEPGRVFVSLAPAGTTRLRDGRGFLLDERTGNPVGPDLERGFTAIVLRLHAQLLLGTTGQLIVAALGVVLVATVVTGFVVYGPVVRRFSFGRLRRGSLRLRLLDVHKLIGGAAWAWNLVVAGTGVLLALGGQLLEHYQRTELAALTASAPERPVPRQVVPIDVALRTAEGAHSGRALAFAIFPGAELAGPRHYAIFSKGTDALSKKLLWLTLVDAETGALTAARELPAYLKALRLAEPLHFGDYGGAALKIVWSLFTVVTLALALSGVWAEVSRRAARRRA